VREKDFPRDEQIALVREIKECARRFDARVTLHGDPALAREAKADGVHLAAGGDAAAARRLLGPAALVGLSIHTVAEARAADPAQVDYSIAGSLFESTSKPGHGPALGPDGLAKIVAAARVPVIAIGGIGAENAPVALKAGAAGVAVMGGLMRAADPAAETRRLLAALGGRW
jgi:thiamine-phosphate pyrophosphorylase